MVEVAEREAALLEEEAVAEELLEETITLEHPLPNRKVSVLPLGIMYSTTARKDRPIK